MNQRGRLESMAGPFPLHVGGGHPAQFVVHQRNQLIGCFLVALAELGQQTRHVATRPRHVAPYGENYNPWAYGNHCEPAKRLYR